MGRAGGRGGVVAGAPVTSGPAVGKPSKIFFELTVPICYGGGGDTLGFLVVVMTDGSLYRYGPVPCDEARAALEAVYGGGPGVPAWSRGEAIGLATIDPRYSTYYIPPAGTLERSGARFDMLIHPALVDLDLGRAVVFSDLLPSGKVTLLEAARKAPQVETWLRAVDRYATWRWSDIPMRVETANGAITVRSAARAGEPVLAMRAYTEKELELDTRYGAGVDLPEFEAAAPFLVDRVLEYRRLDSFMRTLGLVRWTRLQGATEVEQRPEFTGRRPKTPDNLVVDFTERIFALNRVADPKADLCRTATSRQAEVGARADDVAMFVKMVAADCGRLRGVSTARPARVPHR